MCTANARLRACHGTYGVTGRGGSGPRAAHDVHGQGEVACLPLYLWGYGARWFGAEGCSSCTCMSEAGLQPLGSGSESGSGRSSGRISERGSGRSSESVFALSRSSTVRRVQWRMQ
eukprot:112541-Chlamydomonas_euryale.AAC.1